jgi:hypothetical protein
MEELAKTLAELGIEAPQPEAEAEANGAAKKKKKKEKKATKGSEGEASLEAVNGNGVTSAAAAASREESPDDEEEEAAPMDPAEVFQPASREDVCMLASLSVIDGCCSLVAILPEFVLAKLYCVTTQAKRLLAKKKAAQQKKQMSAAALVAAREAKERAKKAKSKKDTSHFNQVCILAPPA